MSYEMAETPSAHYEHTQNDEYKKDKSFQTLSEIPSNGVYDNGYPVFSKDNNIEIIPTT